MTLLEEIVQTVKEATGMTVYASLAPSLTDGIVYEWVPLYNNGALKTFRMEFRIVSDNLKDCYTSSELINQALLECGDGSKLSRIRDIENNGGGTMFDTNNSTHHLFMYYRITTRSEV